MAFHLCGMLQFSLATEHFATLIITIRTMSQLKDMSVTQSESKKVWKTILGCNHMASKDGLNVDTLSFNLVTPSTVTIYTLRVLIY